MSADPGCDSVRYVGPKCTTLRWSASLGRAHRFVARLFFVPSRSRHTRSLCDWSSDVCSSDLGRSALQRLDALEKDAEEQIFPVVAFMRGNAERPRRFRQQIEAGRERLGRGREQIDPAKADRKSVV